MGRATATRENEERQLEHECWLVRFADQYSHTQYSSKSILGCVQHRIKNTFSSSKF